MTSSMKGQLRQSPSCSLILKEHFQPTKSMPAHFLIFCQCTTFPYLSPTWQGSPHSYAKISILPLWDNHELYGCKILHIKGFSGKESENLVRIAKFFLLKEYACTPSENDKLKKRNILHLSEAVGILHVLSTSADLSDINWALAIFPLSGKIYVNKFFSFA